MYKLAICDDDMPLCGQIEKWIQEYGSVYQKHFETDVFFSGDGLLTHMQEHVDYDFIILDICLKDTTGIEVGKQIRNISTGYDIPIVYISTFKDYAFNIIKIRPFNFLIKPLKKDELYSVLGELCKSLDCKNHFFTYKRGSRYLRIAYNKILYFYSNDKKVIIVTKDEELEFWGKLREVETQTDGFFLSIHKSYLINCDFIKEHSYEDIQMADGKVLSISPSRRKTVRAVLFQKIKES